MLKEMKSLTYKAEMLNFLAKAVPEDPNVFKSSQLIQLFDAGISLNIYLFLIIFSMLSY